MEGKINQDGVLEIKRGTKMKIMSCQYQSAACCDECPKFGEPKGEIWIDHWDQNHKIEYTIIKICDERLLKFKEFKDERK